MALSWTVDPRPLGASEAVDPYLAWAEATDFDGHDTAQGIADPQIPVLIELREAERGEEAIEALQRDVPGLRIPGLYRRGSARFCTGRLPRSALAGLAQHVHRFELGLPLPHADIDGALPPSDAPSQARTVIGVIDTDGAFLNEAFLREGTRNTRIAWYWDQGGVAAGPWTRPAGMGYGRELDAAAIDLLRVQIDAGARTEASTYLQLGHLRSVSGGLIERAHGTFVMDIAGGQAERLPLRASAKPVRNPAPGPLPELIFVGLPKLRPGDTSGASPSVNLLDAIRYILERAGPLARVVINLSVGTQAGPHDGSAMIDQAIQEVIRLRKLPLVVAAGNGHGERWNASGTLPAASADALPAALRWFVHPGDVTDSFVELWFKSMVDGNKANVEVRACPPGHLLPPNAGWVASGQTGVLRSASDGRPAGMLLFRDQGEIGKCAMALLAVAPCAGQRAATPPGPWRIELRNLGDAPVEVDAWIQHDEPPRGIDRPMQSFFEEASGGLEIDAGSTLNGIGAIAGAILVGSSRQADQEQAAFSSTEGARPSRRTRRALDFLAPGAMSLAGRGLWGAGVRSGSRIRLAGTSVSAPIVTRQVARMMKTSVPSLATLRKRLAKGGVRKGKSPLRRILPE